MVIPMYCTVHRSRRRVSHLPKEVQRRMLGPEFTGDAKVFWLRILWSARAGRQANGKVVVDVL